MATPKKQLEWEIKAKEYAVAEAKRRGMLVVGVAS
jgi:hypothetical protein